MSFITLKIIPIKPVLAFGSKGKLEYFAISYENGIFGIMVHLHARRVGEIEKSIEQRPYHTYLIADAPEWARNIIQNQMEAV